MSSHIEQIVEDLRYGLRMLWANKTFSAMAIVSLALGIAANTAVFSVVDGVLFKRFPYRDPQQLVLLFERPLKTSGNFGFSPPDFEAVATLARSFAGTAIYQTSATSSRARSPPGGSRPLGFRPSSSTSWA
jgi:putative ABC transport system permease protein